VSTLIPYLFTLVLKVLAKHIQQLAPRCICLVDDVVLIEKWGQELNGLLETWRQALEAYDFRVSRIKSLYM
jgi:hypothetical protein